MEISFDSFLRKNLGPIFKTNSVDLDGVEAKVNINLSEVDSLQANYLAGGEIFSEIVKNKRYR